MSLNFWIVALTVVEVLVSLLLIAVVLVQQTKSGGGLGAMSGGSTESVFGAGASNVLVRITVILASTFFGVTLILVVLTSHRTQAKSAVERLAPAAKSVSLPVQLPQKSGGVTVTTEKAGTPEANTAAASAPAATATAKDATKDAPPATTPEVPAAKAPTPTPAP